MLFQLALLLTGSAQALTADHEAFELLGWNKQCSFAFAHYAYPKLGEAMVAEPIQTRVGTLSIDADADQATEKLVLTLSGPGTWAPDGDRKARGVLAKEGYTFPGWVETIRDAPVANQRDLPRLILSTDTYRSPAATKWLGEPWRRAQVYYSPFASECAAMLYTHGVKPFYKIVLFRIGDPTIRGDRALAHVTNGLLLLEAGDSGGALAEETIAVTMDPDFPPARYHHAALLTLQGQFEPAVDELDVAIKLDPQYKAKARHDKDFDGLRWHPRFDELTK